MSETTDALLRSFAHPEASYRGMPLWVWNGALSKEEIEWQLAELKRHGFGGAFVHPRPGLLTEYLSEDWFRCWGAALEAAKRNHMTLGIYDENSYPSGFAGGHVPAMCPQCLSQSVGFKRLTAAEAAAQYGRAAARPLGVFACRDSENGLEITRDVTRLPIGEWPCGSEQLLAAFLLDSKGTAWQGGFGPVDVLRPEATESFLNSTHAKYGERFGGELGKGIHAIFTDEPYIGNANASNGEEVRVPFSYWFAHQFQKRRGYSILANLPALYGNVSYAGLAYDAPKVRYDYFETLHELWHENYLVPVHQWCQAHGIPLTGHYFEHNWPLADAGAASPAVMSAYEHMDWPGIDLLFSHNLKEAASHPLQIALWEARSAANQLGKKRVLCEINGAGGWDSTLSDYKRMADWAFAGGVNFLCHHLCYGSIAGARKRDHPQSFDWRQPWWEEFGSLNRYFGRLSYLLSQGKMQQRILVLHPTATGYLVARLEEGRTIEKGDVPNRPDMAPYWELLQKLEHNLWDFDLGDEYILERHGHVRGSLYEVGEQRYSVIILSGAMKTMRGSTYKMLLRFAANGGRVLCCRKPGNRLDGSPAPRSYDRLLRMESVAVLDSPEEILAGLARIMDCRAAAGAPLPDGFSHLRRELGGGLTAYFWVNSGKACVRRTFSLAGRSACLLNPWNGAAEDIAFTADRQGQIEIPLELPAGKSLLLCVADDGRWRPRPPRTFSREQVLRLTAQEIRPERENWFPLPYCTLWIDGMEYREQYAPDACETLFRHRGFAGNPWSGAVQYRDVILEQARLDRGDGYRLEYHFTVKRMPKGELFLLAERPELFSAALNGAALRREAAPDALDKSMGRFPIARAVQLGENTISFTYEAFSVLGEIEPVFLVGDFAVLGAGDRWAMEPSRELAPGSIVPQGYPFYPGAVRYEFAFDCAEKPESALLELADVEATCCSVTLNGCGPLLLGVDETANVLEAAPYLEQGRNRLTVRVCAGFKNTFGPHFDPARPRREAWPAMWRERPEGLAAPDAYDLIPYGFSGAMKLTLKK